MAEIEHPLRDDPAAEDAAVQCAPCNGTGYDWQGFKCDSCGGKGERSPETRGEARVRRQVENSYYERG